MGHYDDYEPSQEEKDKKYEADKVRKTYIIHEEVLMKSLLRRYLNKHSRVKGEKYDHSKDYWNKKNEDMLRLIKKLDKKSKGE